MLCCFTISGSFSCPWLVVTPITCTPWSAYFSASWLFLGMARMQGPHQVAQMSTTVILPLRSLLVNDSPLMKPSRLSFGAALPTMDVYASGRPWKEQFAGITLASGAAPRVGMSRGRARRMNQGRDERRIGVFL